MKRSFNQQVVDDYYRKEICKGTNLFGSEISRKIRFDSIVKQFDLNGSSVLDIGCGYAYLLDYLSDKSIKLGDYIGLDPLSELVEKGIRNHPEWGNEIICYDYLDTTDIHQDYNILVSVFDRKFGNTVDSYDYAYKLIEKAIVTSVKGTAITFLSTKKNIIDTGELLFDPIEVYKFASTLTERVMIDSSYAPHVFTLFTWNEPSEFRKAWDRKAWK